MALSDYLEMSDRRFARLAATAEISPERLREISIDGRATSAEVARLSTALGVGVSDLLREDPTPQQAAYRFRAVANRSPTSEHVKRRTISEIAARIDGIDEVIESGNQVRCAWAAPQELRQDAFALASWFRESCFDGDQVAPVTSLAKVLDSCLGIVTVVLKRSEIDGVCAVVNGTPYIFVRAQFRPRMLFTLAHELGHLLAHAQDEDFASLDPLGSVERRPPNRIEERFANNFATELLLPRAGVGVALQTIRDTFRIEGPVGDIEILLLSHIFGVSFEVAARRCEFLELLPIGGAASLLEFLSGEFGSPERRAVEAGLPERELMDFPAVSSNVLRAAANAVANGDVSLGRVLDRLQVTYSDILEQHRENAVEYRH